jgi:hypothetical protein
MEKKIVILETTKRGYPALWEQGGATTNMATVVLVTSPEGEPLSPLYVRNRGQRVCRAHALLPIKGGYHIIRIDRWRETSTIVVGRVASLEKIKASDLVNYKGFEDWRVQPSTFLPRLPGCWWEARYEKGEVWLASLEIIKGVIKSDEEKWETELPLFLEAAVRAAKEKSRCYHCRRPHYVVRIGDDDDLD